MIDKLRLLLAISFSFITIVAAGESSDTISISAKSFQLSKLKQGIISYIVYNKKNMTSPASGIYLSNIKIEKITYHNVPALAITQKWVKPDTIFHSAYTVLKGSDFSTLYHETYWNRNLYTLKFDFETKVVTFTGSIEDSLKTKVISDFHESLQHYNLNWHSDLVIFRLLPYKKGRVFKINLYDPGFGRATEVFYSVLRKEKISVNTGEPLNCWVLENEIPGGGYQRFWVSEQSGEIIIEEDYYNKSYRYKIKLTVADNIFQ
ncbi:MAG: hypothetical protein ABIO32_07160 [Ferruginibacter sp.]